MHTPGAYPRIMIGDFGLARPNADQATFNVVGTVSYLPPEGVLALDRKVREPFMARRTPPDPDYRILPMLGEYTTSSRQQSSLIDMRSLPSDCWSAGVIMYIMLTYVVPPNR